MRLAVQIAPFPRQSSVIGTGGGVVATTVTGGCAAQLVVRRSSAPAARVVMFMLSYRPRWSRCYAPHGGNRRRCAQVCTVNVTPAAESSLAALLVALRDALARDAGVDPETVRVGPVDLGT